MRRIFLYFLLGSFYLKPMSATCIEREAGPIPTNTLSLMPKAIWDNVFLKMIDKNSALTLRQCSKAFYENLQSNPITGQHFRKKGITEKRFHVMRAYYEIPDIQHTIFDHAWWQSPIEQALNKMKAIEFFAERSPGIKLDLPFIRFAKYEWCENLRSDETYWRMKGKYAPNVKASAYIKLMTATQGQGNLFTLTCLMIRCYFEEDLRNELITPLQRAKINIYLIQELTYKE